MHTKEELWGEQAGSNWKKHDADGMGRGAWGMERGV